MNRSLPFPATPGRAATAFTDLPYSKKESDAESMQRPSLFISYYEGKLSADLRYQGGLITGVELIICLLGNVFPSFPALAVVVWSPTEKYATLGMTCDEARKILHEYAAKAWLDGIIAPRRAA